MSHFLDSTDSAIAWALENVGDAREDYPRGRSSYDESLRQRKEEEVGDYTAEYAKVTRAGMAPVWRAVEIPRGENPRLWIDWDELGTHWSFRRSGAGVYSGGKVRGPTETVVIEATVKAEDIDWEYGFTSFWYYGTEQFECALKEGSTVEVVKVSGKPEADLRARANPGQRNVHYLVVISKGPLVIVRVPWPMPKWSSIMAAVTIVMREHGLKQKDVTSVEAVGYMRGIDEQDLWTEDDRQAADRLDAAFAGDKTKYGPFWLYDWRDGSAEAEAKLRAARKQADALRRRIEVLKTDVGGRFELVRKPTGQTKTNRLRMNMDDEIRALERAAAQGDPHALARLRKALKRAGVHEPRTYNALGARVEVITRRTPGGSLYHEGHGSENAVAHVQDGEALVVVGHMRRWRDGMGVRVRAITADKRLVHDEVVRCGEAWDASATNSLGTPGAYVAVPPSAARIAQEVASADLALSQDLGQAPV